MIEPKNIRTEKIRDGSITVGELMELCSREQFIDWAVSFAGLNSRALYNRETDTILLDDDYDEAGWEEIDFCWPLKECEGITDNTKISVMGENYSVYADHGSRTILLDELEEAES